jgi:LPS-assembly lipoprotein
VRAAWTLQPVAPGTPLTGVQSVTTTYAAADQPYAAIAAQQDGEDRAAAELARLIRLDLMRALAE